MSRLVQIHTKRRPRVERVGNKAAMLTRLARAGFDVPKGFVVPARQFDTFVRRTLHPDNWPASLLEREAWDEARLEQVRDQIMQGALPVSLRHDLRIALAELRSTSDMRFVVRSSSPTEDTVEASGAGLFLSLLGLGSDDDVFDAIKQVWASLYRPAVIEHLSAFSVASPSLAIIVQQMIDADVHGVVFSVNPLSGDPSEMVIDAQAGVADTARPEHPDTIRVDRGSGDIRDAVIANPEGASALEATQVRALAHLADQVELQLGVPQDIEWGIEGARLWVFQSRPVTRLGLMEATTTPETVWTNANVAEALPGVVTPLTWSTMRRFSEHGFTTMFRTLGCRVPQDQLFVGNFRGRIYLNFSALLDVLGQIPGVRPEMLTALGGGDASGAVIRTAVRDKFGYLARMPLTTWRLSRTAWKTLRTEREMHSGRRTEIDRLDRLDLRVLSASGLDQVLWDAERLLRGAGEQLLRTMALLIALLGGGRALGSLAALRSGPSWLSGLPTAVVHELESAKPAWELEAVLTQIRGDEAAARYLREADAPNLDEFPEGPGRAAFERYLSRFGHRGHRETELAEPRWREKPQSLLRLLRVRLSEDEPVERVSSPGRPPAVTAPWRKRFADLVRAREALRSDVVKVLGVLRKVALEAESRMRARAADLPEGAVFFLTLDELHDVLAERRTVVAPLVRFRMRLFERERALPDPPPQFIGRPPPAPPPIDSDAKLEGLGVSPGLVRGKAVVVSTPEQAAELASDEIAVLRVVDVSWMPFLSGSLGVVAELGGPLSHAAVVLRELGVPAVFNVRQATSSIENGTTIVLDGDRGVVHR